MSWVAICVDVVRMTLSGILQDSERSDTDLQQRHLKPWTTEISG